LVSKSVSKETTVKVYFIVGLRILQSNLQSTVFVYVFLSVSVSLLICCIVVYGHCHLKSNDLI